MKTRVSLKVRVEPEQAGALRVSLTERFGYTVELEETSFEDYKVYVYAPVDKGDQIRGFAQGFLQGWDAATTNKSVFTERYYHG